MSGQPWLPIDTAPRDNTRIDVWVRSVSDRGEVEEWRVADAYWNTTGVLDPHFSNGPEKPGWYAPGFFYEGCEGPIEFHVGYDPTQRVPNTVTHWMPKPAGPRREGSTP